MNKDDYDDAIEDIKAIGLLAMLVLVGIVSGPIALIISIIALVRTMQ